MRLLLITFSLPIVILGILIAYILSTYPKLKPITPPEPGWYGVGPPKKDDVTLRPFRVNMSSDDLTDLKQRLQGARFGSDLEDGNFYYGFQVSYLYIHLVYCHDCS